MFYAAEALLLTKELRFHKHYAVISALGKDFVAANQFPKHLHSFLTAAFNMRNAGDYIAKDVISNTSAAKVLSQSAEFLEYTKQYLNSIGFNL